MFVGALDLTVVSAVLPAVLFELGIPLQSGLDEASWVVSGYFLAYALGMLVMGRASDLVGRRRTFLACLALFFVGSLGVATSTGAPAEWIAEVGRAIGGGLPDRAFSALYAVIAGRVVQGFGAGAMVPVGMALVADLFPAGRRAVPLGVIGAVDIAGWMLGHLYGGLVVQVLPWQALFWLNLPVAVIAFVLVWALRRDEGITGGSFDLPGTSLAALALLGLNAGLAANETGPAGLAVPDRAPPYAAPALLAALAAFLGFLWVERRARAPLLDLRLLAARGPGFAGVVNLLVGFSLMVGLVSVPLLVNAVGARTSALAALASGYLLSTFTLPMAFAALAGGPLATRLGPRALAAAGLSLACVGFSLLTRVRPEAPRQAIAVVDGGSLASAAAPELQAMIVALLLVGVGLGLTVAPLGAAVMEAAPREARGMAAALVIVLRLLGMMVSVSALTTYGVRRWAVLSPDAFAAIPLQDAARLLETGLRLTTQIAAEMSTLAVACCLLALLAALGLPGRAKA